MCEREFESAAHTIAAWTELCGKLERELAAAVKRAEAAEADAKRYRWLRDNPTWIGFDSDYAAHLIDVSVDEAMRNG